MLRAIDVEFLCDRHSLTLFSLRFVFAFVFPCLARWIQFCQLLEYGVRGRYFGRRLCARTKDENGVATTRTMNIHCNREYSIGLFFLSLSLSHIYIYSYIYPTCQASILRVGKRYIRSRMQNDSDSALRECKKVGKVFLLLVWRIRMGKPSLLLRTRKMDTAMDGYTSQ